MLNGISMCYFEIYFNLVIILTDLWTKKTELEFFKESLDNAKTPEQLFYVTKDGRYLAYWPRDYKGPRTTLQSRNSLIGIFTEKWSKHIIQKAIGNNDKLYAVRSAVCNEIALTKRSPGDVVISRNKSVKQRAEDIIVIFEIKMSVVWNWEYIKENRKSNRFKCIGDYKTHFGIPGMLRSDSMLKAIGKSVNIRISSPKASQIPIIILGNTPITQSYYNKVDRLCKTGVIQGFWSVNPEPLDCKNSKDNLKTTQKGGFYRFNSFEEFKNRIISLYSQEKTFFSSMKSKKELGKIIEIANKQKTDEEKGKLFIRLIGE
jgi:hypothetical protein